jgi:sulfite reductase (NADPH) hemoprotein beta-component
LNEIAPLLQAFSRERERGEHFGDFVIRKGIVQATILGTDFHAAVS